uniref:ATP synthase F0 subunit 6 n=1 Tax=Paragonimus skrjabini miyazakii TaxID=59628 RepID=UPI0021D524E7|nr:ATP synthase F0 subunit 6 [Paragonimus skrjabini miyazakii]UXE35007.1 ATP synthase F0 subunit 6 [Paragonimus skrjabini miyazakii]
MCVTRLGSISSFLEGLIVGGGGDFVYRIVLCGLLFCFLGLRFPYIFGLGGFGLFLFLVISPLFLALFFSRLFDGSVISFFSSFVPEGTPLWIAPFVCMAETLSYLVRPVVLMIRPFVNLSMGASGGYVLGLLSFRFEWVAFFLLFLFFYEVFVAIVHWFIVCNILSFSEDH